jgi:hypothetical protein
MPMTDSNPNVFESLRINTGNIKEEEAVPIQTDVQTSTKLSSIMVNDYFKNSPLPTTGDHLLDLYNLEQIKAQKSPIYSIDQVNQMQASLIFDTELGEDGFHIVHVRHRRREEKIEARKEKTIDPNQKLMDDGNVEAIEVLISENDPSMKSVILRDKNLNDDDVDFLCEALLYNTTVKELDISNNPLITDSSTNSLCKLIKSSKTLQRLYIDGTSIRVFDDIIESLSRNLYIIDMILPDQALMEEHDLVERYLTRNEMLYCK